MSIEAATPELALFQPVSPTVLRAIAASAGDWSGAVVREVARILGQAAGRRPEALALGLDELHSRGVVQQQEAEDLKKLIDAFYRVARGKGEPGADRDTVLDLHARISLDPEASPAAVAIASVAARNVMLPRGSGTGQEQVAMAASATFTPASTGAGAVVGAVVGAGFGAAVGGVVGAGIGALIGAAAGAAVGFSNENEV